MMTDRTEQDIARMEYERNIPKYHVTGVLRNGKRFPCKVFSSYFYAMSINLWNGSVWEVRNGHRKRIKRVYN